MVDSTAIAPSLTELIQLHSGTHVVKKALPSRVFYEFQDLAAKVGGGEAIKWITMQMFEVIGDDGERSPLNISTLEDELEFEDAAEMSAIINQSFMPYLNNSGEVAPKDAVFVLPCGLTVGRRKMKGRTFYQFQEKAAKDGGAAAIKWVTLQAFEFVSNEERSPLTQADIDGMGFEDAAMLSAVINKVFTPFLERKTP
jgi:hypothetical protein